MSKVSAIDMGALRGRLLVALRGELPGSLFLQAIGSLLLSAAPDHPTENALWDSLFELQARLENVNGSELLASLANVTGAS